MTRMMDVNLGDAVGDRYFVKSILGEGPNGKVYRALDQLLNREIAYKGPSTLPHGASTAGAERKNGIPDQPSRDDPLVAHRPPSA